MGLETIIKIQDLPSPGAVKEKEQLLESSSIFQLGSGIHRPHKSYENPWIGTGYVILGAQGKMKMYGHLFKNDEEFLGGDNRAVNQGQGPSSERTGSCLSA